MSTVAPRRTFFSHALSWDIDWSIAGAGVPANALDYLRLAYDGAGSAPTRRAALLFRPTLPLWAETGSSRWHPGNIEDMCGTLHLWVEKPDANAEIELAYPAAPLTAGMTVAQLETAYAGATVEATTIPVTQNGWLSIVIYANWEDLRTNGVILTLTDPGTNSLADVCIGRASMSRGAIYCTHFQYAIRTSIDVSDPVRADLTAVEDYLTGLHSPHVTVTGALALDQIDPAQTELDLEEQVEAEEGITLVATVDPLRSWELDVENGSTLIIRQPDLLTNLVDTAAYRQLRGCPVDLRLNLTGPSGASTELARLLYDAGAPEQAPGRLSVPLDSVNAGQLDGDLKLVLPGEYEGTGVAPTMNWALESPVVILFDALMNGCSRTHWDNILAGDWYWLLTRFVSTWTQHTLGATYLADVKSVLDLAELAGLQRMLFVGSDLSGNPRAWHPAAYRPSLQVHTLDLDNETTDPVLRSLAGRTYAGLSLTVTDSGGTDYEYRWRDNPGLSPLETGEMFEMSTDIFPQAITRYIREAIYRQMMQRVLSEVIEVEARIGLRCLTWQLGDQVIVSSEVYGLDAVPFMVTHIEASVASGEASVRMCHYTDWPGGHSLFQQDGPLGLWRWETHGGALNLANETWNPSKVADFANTSAATVAILGGSWEGAALKVTTGTDKFLDNTGIIPDATAALIDIVEVQVGNWNTSVQLQGDGDMDWIWRWYDQGDRNGPGLALLVVNPDAPNPIANGGAYYMVVASSACKIDPGDDWTASITGSVILPYGVGAASDAANPAGIRSISVLWLADGSVRVYDAGHYVGSIAGPVAKTGAHCPTQFDLRSCETINTGSAHLTPFALRYDQQSSLTVAESMLLPLDGLDPYYP